MRRIRFVQVYHYCHYDGRQDSFLCPKGTVFNQDVLVCDWWYNSACYGGTVVDRFIKKRRSGGVVGTTEVGEPGVCCIMRAHVAPTRAHVVRRIIMRPKFIIKGGA